jgi:TetR/AcrR family transcriptional regulator, transcriptional repressor for nem operon
LTSRVDWSNIVNMEKVAHKGSCRTALIEKGIDIMLQKGYYHTGLAEVLKSCAVPKGSFYHYFKSKEDYGLAIIDTFDEKYVAQLDVILKDESLSPLARLHRYVDETIEQAEQRQCSRGCLIANLSQEMADQNEVFRSRLKEVILKRRAILARVIDEAIQKGEIRGSIHPMEAAEFFLCAWEGTIMRAKVLRDTGPYLIFKQMIFARLLKA